MYQNDADFLALRETLLSSDNPYKDSVAIDPDLSAYFLSNLIAVYNAISNNDEFGISYIHIHGAESMKGIYTWVGEDDIPDWVTMIHSGKETSGYPALDSIQSLYKITINIKERGWGLVFFNLETNVNTSKLIQIFKDDLDISTASADAVGGGNDIIVERKDGYTELNYIRGYGDCPAGCLNYSTVGTFHYYEDCSIQIIQIVNNNQNKMTIHVYPSPFSDVLQIENSSEYQTYSISDLSGKVLADGNVAPELNLGHLGSGQYLITLKSVSRLSTIRTIKQ